VPDYKQDGTPLPSVPDYKQDYEREEATVLVLGCGTMGLLTMAALRALGHRGRILAAAKYPHQQELARKLGADALLRTGRGLYEDFCRQTGATSHQPELGKPVLLGGVDVTFDCVGAATTIDDALRFTRPRGTVALVGMPAIPRNVDWTSIWYKELRVFGTYAYGWETLHGERVRTFDLALRLLRERAEELAPLVGATFPLSEYRQALASALHSGRSGVVKTAFVMEGRG
jgi:threonine dehydrogenase-like Zn-dependent dehydrogenase